MPISSAQNDITEEPGQRLKRRREALGLRYRDVELASNAIAGRHGNSEYVINLSRLADVENKGTIPSIYKLYSLSAIYRMDLAELLQWYGIDVTRAAADASMVEPASTHVVGFKNLGLGSLPLPLALDPGLDTRRTTYLSRLVQRWGMVPVMMLAGLDIQRHRYAFIGTEDWSMYPILQPGSLLLIDETRRRIVESPWTTEWERPIYFLERRGGYTIGWCDLNEGQLVVHPHPASHAKAEVYAFPEEIDVIGQVTGVAMRLYPAKQHRARS